MSNKWVEHVRQYAKKKKISYGCAITEAKASYTKVPTKKQETKQNNQLKAIIAAAKKMKKIKVKK